LCLVETRPGPRYAALSYVWGPVGKQEGILKTLKSNIQRLKTPGSLEKIGKSEKLPNTLWDAISLSSSLSIPYLWVDSLCIVQDDDETRGAQLGAMASIYANAYITLVAA
ncbi:hypothetical protein EJ04DRAFT_417379, partial [Polyplosphaeria fusca]